MRSDRVDVIRPAWLQTVRRELQARLRPDVPSVEGITGGTSPGPKAGSTATAVKAFIDQNWQQPLTLRAVAVATHLHRRHVERLFAADFGCTVHEYQSYLRAQAAFDLLFATDLKIEAIAVTVGYRSKKDLYRLLRVYLGLTPGQIRQAAKDGKLARVLVLRHLPAIHDDDRRCAELSEKMTPPRALCALRPLP